MIFKACLTLILLMNMSGTGIAATPRYATDLQSYDASAKVVDKMIRMRISAASETSSQARKLVAIGDILLCGAGSCYRARAAGNTAIGDTARGSATVLSDVVIPRTTITDVYFSEPVAATGLSGHLTLPAPLVIEQDMQGIELFITVRKQLIGQRTQFIPAQFASMYFNPESELVHYVPSTATVAALSRGATLGIPAGALTHPQIFHIGVLDTGETFPKIDIYPYIDLAKAATLEVRALRATVNADELVVPIHPAAPDGAPASAPAIASGPASRITLKRTALIEPNRSYPPRLGH